jgi:hypothetical protein
MERASALVRRFQYFQRGFQIFSGIFLVIIGTMLLTNRMTLIAIWAQAGTWIFPWAGLLSPFLIAILAGLIVSLACVLPRTGLWGISAAGRSLVYQSR